MKDQLGRIVSLDKPAQRIVCLVPSITELLADLGLTKQIVGRTKFCVFSPSLKDSTPSIGGTKQVDFNKIQSLKPDLIICNKEENTQEIVETLEKDYPVYVSNIQTIHSALDMIHDIGLLTGKQKEAARIIDEIEVNRSNFYKNPPLPHTCLYMIWQKPYMTVGKDTFIYHMLQECNLNSIVNDFRYPEISEDFIQKSNCDIILLSSEPFPFKGEHKIDLEKKFPDKRFVLVDGTYFSWYGSRLRLSYDYFEQLLLSL